MMGVCLHCGQEYEGLDAMEEHQQSCGPGGEDHRKHLNGTLIHGKSHPERKKS